MYLPRTLLSLLTLLLLFATPHSLRAEVPSDTPRSHQVVMQVYSAIGTATAESVQRGELSVSPGTAAAEATGQEADWRSGLLATITHPQIALLLLMIGVCGLLFELMSPGAIFPGVIGALSLLLGLYGLAALPISWVGAALAVLGIGLLVAEGFLSTFGALAIVGVMALAAGLALVVDTDDLPGLTVSWPFVAGLSVAAGGLILLTARAALRSSHRPLDAGTGAMLDAPAEVIDWDGNAGHVFVHGERWQARSERPLLAGQHVRVRAIDGLTVFVGPAVEAGQVPSPQAKET